MSLRAGAIERQGSSARLGAIAAILGLAFVVITALLIGGRDDQNSGLPNRGVGRPGSPLPTGQQVSLQEATIRSATPVYRPNDKLASDSLIKEVWLRTESMPEIFIIYANGLHVSVRPGSEGQGTKEFAEAQIADGVPGTIERLGSVDAFVVPPIEGRGDGSVRFVIPDAIISVVGNGSFTVDDLLGVAKSVLQGVPQAQAEHAAASADEA